MARGVLQLCSAPKYGARIENCCKIFNASNKNTAARWLSTHVSRRLLQKQTDVKSASPAEVKGIPYKQLTIGVPKERWQNEKRYVLSK